MEQLFCLICFLFISGIPSCVTVPADMQKSGNTLRTLTVESEDPSDCWYYNNNSELKPTQGYSQSS